MRRAILAMLTVVAAACSLPNSRSQTTVDPWAGGESATCTTIEVDNQRFERVIVWFQHTRIGSVEGKTRETLKTCLSGTPEFTVHFISGETFRPEVDGAVARLGTTGQRLHMFLGRTRTQSFVIPSHVSGFNGPMEDDFYVLGVTPIRPYGLHLGVWMDVARCLKISPIPNPSQIQWFVADALVDTRNEVLTYGATEFVGDSAVAIYLDRKYAFHAGVVSHEVVHALAGEEEPAQCVMPVPGDLPLRPIPDEILEQIRG